MILRICLVAALAACGESAPPPNHPPPAMPSNRIAEPAPTPPPPVVASHLPPACIEYRDTIMAMSRCEKMPAASIDAMKQGIAAMEQGFASYDSLPPDSRTQVLQAASEGCKSATDAVKQALVAMGC